MLFRKHDGTLVAINRCDYKNDQIYYSKIMEVISPKANISLNIVETGDEPTSLSVAERQLAHKDSCGSMPDESIRANPVNGVSTPLNSIQQLLSIIG